MHPVDLLIFDLDGTLVDTRQDLANSINHARRAFELSDLELSEVMKYVGDGVRKLMERSLAQANADEVQRAVSIFKEHYGAHLLDFSELYPGVQKTLAHFHSKKKAVISNKPEGFTRAILAGLKIEDSFDLVIGGDSLSVLKPDPASILYTMETLAIEPARSVMIGDSTSDIEAGRRANVLTCGVTYGFRPRRVLESARPDFLIDDLRDVMTLFK